MVLGKVKGASGSRAILKNNGFRVKPGMTKRAI
jgi:hypothetical protein